MSLSPSLSLFSASAQAFFFQAAKSSQSSTVGRCPHSINCRPKACISFGLPQNLGGTPQLHVKNPAPGGLIHGGGRRLLHYCHPLLHLFLAPGLSAAYREDFDPLQCTLLGRSRLIHRPHALPQCACQGRRQPRASHYHYRNCPLQYNESTNPLGRKKLLTRVAYQHHLQKIGTRRAWTIVV